ncbi:MAG: D-alanine--D-alanine ligase [Opitutales bacterium]|nr:D-alanine--D-alanine ligase [Opitutales bacterium]
MNSADPEFVVLSGGCSREREVSLVSGRSVYDQLAVHHSSRLLVLDAEALPHGLDPGLQIIVPMLHGQFGEDGQLQGLLESEGFVYVGSDARSSALCMDKVASKGTAAKVGVPVLPEATGNANGMQGLDAVLLGHTEWVVKPVREGSSVGLFTISGKEALLDGIGRLGEGDWMVEPRLHGHDLTVGVLAGKAQGIVEIFPEGGVYDYAHKYQPGSTRYRFPAEIPDALTQRLRDWAEAIFAACGCRDFARVDFFLDSSGNPYFLEINTLPGMTPTSLLPKSAQVCGYAFETLVEAMVSPAAARWKSRQIHPQMP